jgi:hypothetical protein
MTVGRVSTLTVEVLRRADPAARVSTLTVEALRRGDPAARVSTLTVEVLVKYPQPIDIDYVIPFSSLKHVTDFIEGDGLSIDSPLLIYNTDDLINMDLAKHYALANDIDVTAENWTPLGATSTPLTGSLDGHGFKIFGLNSTYATNNFGLFYEITTGTIRRLGVATTVAGITAQSSSLYSAVLVGAGHNTTGWLIEDCWVEGKVDTGGDRAGGLIGITNNGGSPDSDLRRNRVAVWLSGTIGTRVGGVTGYSNSTGLTHSDNYFDSDVATTTAQGTGSVGTAKTTTLMQEEATFANFDFVDTWFIDEGVDYPYLWTLPATRPAPIEWSGELLLDHEIPVEWQLEVDPGIESDHAILIEWRQGIAQNHVIPIAWLQGLAIDNSVPVEWTQGILQNHEIPVEWNTVIVPGDYAIPVEWRQGLASDHEMPYDWRQPEVQADSIILIDWTTELLLDHQILFEWINEIVPGDHVIPVEWVQGVATDNEIPITWSGPLGVDHEIPFNWSGVIDADRSIPIEWTTSLLQDHQVPAEWTGGVSQDNEIPVQWSGPLGVDHVIPYAWRGPFADPGSDYVILIDWTTELELDQSIPVEWALDVFADQGMPIEWLLESVIVSLHEIPINWSGPVTSDHVIPYEWMTIIFLELDQQMPIEWHLELEIDRTIPVEWLLGLFGDHTIPVEYHGELLLDGSIPVEWQTPFAAVDFVTPIEWRTELQLDHTMPIEWSLAVLDDNAIPTEWTLDVGPTSSIPVGWVGALGVVCDDVTVSPWSSGSHYTAFGWFGIARLGYTSGAEWRMVLSYGGFNVQVGEPIESAEYVGSSPLTTTLTIDVDVHAELAVDPPAGSGTHLPTTYTLTTAFTNLTYPPSPGGVRPTVDLTSVMEELRDIGALASPAYNVNLVFVDRSGVEGASDVHSVSSLNVIANCDAPEYEIPFEWGGVLGLDNEIPVEWAQEVVVFQDHPLPIEWQQIFFKQFDHMIPWEALGISDTASTLPVEWGGSPGAEAVIPIEWTDPLFALFVTHLDDCNFWVAACDPTEWAAACWNSGWVAEPLEVVEQSDAADLEWGARPEEIGGTWCAELRKAAWETSDNERLWTSDGPCTGWLAEAYDTDWGTQTQSTVWNASRQGTRWTVLEPNVRGDR